MKNPLLRFYADNKKYWPGLVLVVVFAMLSGVCTTFASTLWGSAVDYGLARQTRPMLLAAAGMAGFVLLDSARTGVHYKIIGKVTEGMFFDLRAWAFRKIAKGDPAILQEKYRSGDVATRVNSDIDGLNGFVAGEFADYARRIFKAGFALIACLFLSWQLTLAYGLILPLTVWLVGRVSKPIHTRVKTGMDNVGSGMSVLSDAVTGALTVKAFGLEEVLAQKFDRFADGACEQTLKTEKLNMGLTAIKYVVSVVQTMSLFLIGSLLVTRGVLSVGDLLAFIALSVYIADMTALIDRLAFSVRKAGATAQRLYEVLDIPDERPGTVTEPASETPCTTNDLAFSYNENAHVLNGVELRIGKGKKVAVVGASGCGKSTLMNLICRFYLPESGSLRLFGEESAQWDADGLRRNMALVTQDSLLFDGSIYENIAYGRPGLTRAECEQALKDVGLWEFVSAFPESMDHPIGESGSQLSGGQKQRLCIARAMVKQAPLVLLDEATSALDLQTEKEVQKSLDKLLEGRSAVIIAHRLSTVQNADYVYCMEDGKVLEEGTPADLLARKGRYYEMCKLQGSVST